MSEQPKIHVWITKHALTQGIFEAEAEVCESISPRMIAVGRYECFHKPDWHTTKEEAKSRVDEMIRAKLKSLETSRAKMEALGIRCQSEFDSMIKVKAATRE